MAATLAARGIPVRRVAPAVDADRFGAIAPRPPRAPLSVLYAGTVGLAHGLETLVQAARIAGGDRARVTIAGGGSELSAVETAAQGAANVRLLGVVPAARVPALYAAADAGVVLLRDRPLFAGALPTKLLEVMAAARPAVLAARGEAAALVERTDAGIAVAPEDPAALVEAWARLLAAPAEAVAMGERGRVLVLREFSRAAMVERWAELLESAAAQRALL
jgi:glycosyltransferase involved in cell wall biosynthesis